MQYVFLSVAAVTLSLAAWGDVRGRRIPNAISLVLVVLAVWRLALAGDICAAFYTIAAAAAVFAGGFLLFWRGLIGGGDVKLAAATVLIVGHHAVAGFLVLMSLCGLLVTLATLAASKLVPRLAAVPHAALPGKAARPTVPYGVAIAAAGILVLLLQSPISG